MYSSKCRTLNSSSLIDIFVICYVPDNFLGCCQPLCIIVRNLKPEFVLDCHDNFYVVEGVQSEVLHEVRIECNFGVVYLVVEVQYEHGSLFDGFQSQGRSSTVTNELEQRR